jgi:N-acetylglutamate synthase-like GNAT family acetyltransferase
MGQTAADIGLRHELRPGDIGAVVTTHGLLYSRELGFDATFEAYVAGPLAAFVLRESPRERLWLAERDGRLVGCIAIVADSEAVAQLRWFLVMPEARGAGLGRRLIDDAVGFCRQAGYQRIILWTVSALAAAAHLYKSTGFRRVEANPGRRWGVDLVEEKYEMDLVIW